MSAVAVDRAVVPGGGEHERAARVARARAALARAEERTGAARWVRPVRPVPVGPDAADEPAPGAPPAPATQPEVEPEGSARVLPVAQHLGRLLPSGGLDRGSTVVVQGSTSLVLALLVEASRAGSWVVVVGLPEVGVLAAHHLGLVLDRVVLVPSPGPDAPVVLAALLDGFDVVVVGPEVPLSAADQRRLGARARERSAVLLPTGTWPGAHVVLTAERSQWEGLGKGDGRLRTRRLTVRRSGRGSAALTRSTDVQVPGGGTVGSPAGRRAVLPAAEVAVPEERAG